MERNEIESKLKNIISDELSIDKDQIKFDSKLREEFGADSLDVLHMIMQLEDEFEIEIYNNEWKKLETLSEATDLVISKLDERREFIRDCS